MPYLTVFRDKFPISADYHQQYLAKNSLWVLRPGRMRS
jgi:hypothetical protein